MFGYIRPCECELKVREQTLYRAYYCGLCRCIGKCCGQRARLLLDYDCAFLAMMLTQAKGEPVLEDRRCGLKPYRGKRPMVSKSDALAYAADVNVLLGYWKLADDWQDERRPDALAGKWLLRPAFRKAAARRRELYGELDVRMRELGVIQQSCSPETDLPACAFGELMRAVIRHAPGLTPANRDAMEWMFFNLGRWIYLIDAWEDRHKDGERGQYNVFNVASTSPEDAAFLLNISLAEACKAYDLVAFAGGAGITDNIMSLGLWQRTRKDVDKERLDESI